MTRYQSTSKRWYQWLGILIILGFILGACSPTTTPLPSSTLEKTENLITETATVTSTPFVPDEPTPTNTLTPSPEPAQTVWIAPYIPSDLHQAIGIPPGTKESNDPANASLLLDIGQDEPVARWVYALVAPFPTIPEGISSADLHSHWLGTGGGLFDKKPLLMTQETLDIFSSLWGTPAENAVKVLPVDSILDSAWNEQPSWALIPFEALEPRWKVLQVDGLSPLWKTFNPEQYPLTVPFTLVGDPDLAQSVRSEMAKISILPISNRDPQKLTTVILTGVTALVRATAETMRRKGNTYPAKDVGPILREADIAHISNEIPFVKNCPLPDPNQVGLRFCSQPSYIELLEEVGTDVVELTGDHFADWGPDAMKYTLQMYKDRNWIYYGGGENRNDARQARLIEHNGNKIAFIGCNAKGGGYATAKQNNPGAVSCDYDWMHSEIDRLTKEGFNVITTFQHFEYYTYKAQPNQVKDSRGMAEAGAVIVSGSQAHQPQAFEFHNNALIHYGLGNLFFDQYFMGLPTSQGFLDRYVFYDGQLISSELIGIKFVDFARPRLMTPAEKRELLQAVFKASGWK